MEVPHLVREHLGDEAIEASVSLGDEDVVCVTPSRALVYRGEGLLSDESVETYSLDVERFDLSQGRRKTKFIFEYVDGTESFTVPGNRADSLLSLLVQGLLRVEGVIADEESVAGIYQFSELTLVVADSRLIKHIGTSVWDDDFEVYDYDDVSGLEFEEGSVATQIVITVDGRPQRIKAPNDEAPQVEQTLVQALCAHYEVSSLAQLKRTLAERAEAASSTASADVASSSDDLGLDEDISPLVGDDASSAETVGDDVQLDADESVQSASAQTGQASERIEDTTPTRSDSPVPESGVDAADIEAIEEQLAALTEVVKRQNELLKQQDDRIDAHDQRIEQLIDELRRGR